MATTFITVHGRIGQEFTTGTTSDGKKWARTTLATTDRRRNSAGEWEDAATVWHTLFFRGKLAEGARECFSKGDLIMVYGALTHGEHEGKVQSTISVQLAGAMPVASQEVIIKRQKRTNSTSSAKPAPKPATPDAESDPWSA